MYIYMYIIYMDTDNCNMSIWIGERELKPSEHNSRSLPHHADLQGSYFV